MMLELVAADEEWGNRALLMIRLQEIHEKTITGVMPEMIEGTILVIRDMASWNVQKLEADNFIVATSTDSCRDLYEELTGSGAEMISVGDCHRPGTIRDAIYQGASAARRISI